MERLLDQTASTYPAVTVNLLKSEQIKAILEDVADNLFNRDPYLQQGGDIVRVGGLRYTCQPGAAMGSRISGLRLGDAALDSAKTYKVASWAGVSEGVEGPAIWDVVAGYLRDRRTLAPPAVNLPTLHVIGGNPGLT
jgi:sulfur-oxidizing protein SoxB